VGVVDEDGHDRVVVARRRLLAGGVADPPRARHDVGPGRRVGGRLACGGLRGGLGGAFDAVGAQHQGDGGGHARQTAERHRDRPGQARGAGPAGYPGGAALPRPSRSPGDTHGSTVGPIGAARDVYCATRWNHRPGPRRFPGCTRAGRPGRCPFARVADHRAPPPRIGGPERKAACVDLLDILLLLIVLAYAASGYRRGLLAGCVSLAGFVGGAVIGVWLLPWVMDLVTPGTTTATVTAVFTVLLPAVAGHELAGRLALRLRRELDRG